MRCTVFGEKEGHWVMSPLFKDHTIYGAMVAFAFFVLMGLFLSKKYNPLTTLVICGLILINLIGLYFSYTRAKMVKCHCIAWYLGINSLPCEIFVFTDHFYCCFNGCFTELGQHFVRNVKKQKRTYDRKFWRPFAKFHQCFVRCV